MFVINLFVILFTAATYIEASEVGTMDITVVIDESKELEDGDNFRLRVYQKENLIK